MTRLLALAAAAAVAFAATGASGAEQLVTQSGVIGEPKDGMGQIVFYRPSSLFGAIMGCTVNEGEKQVARLGNGKYAVISAPPGKHVYFTEAAAEADRHLYLDIYPGKTYFVECHIGTGVVAGHAKLLTKQRDEFADKAEHLELWDGGLTQIGR